jgi:hypothetical protein
MAITSEQPAMTELASLQGRINSVRRKVTGKRPGQEALCLRPVDRFDALCGVLASVSDFQRLAVQQRFADAVAAYRDAINWQDHYHYILYWIATGQRLADHVRNMHMRINTIYDALGVVEAPQLSAWGHHWDAEYSQLVQWLVAEAERFNATRLRAEVKNNPIKIRDFLAIIKLQLAVHAEGQDQTTDAVDQEMDAPDQGIDAPDVDMDKETKCSDMSTVDDMMALMRSTLDKLTDPDVDPGEINTWFIPREGVIYDKKNPFGQGFFSLFYKGTWVGSDEAVGIKTLDENDNGATFSREFSTWWLLRHPNILEMYGANHIETPCFFVCELASENFISFFQDGDNRHLLWTKFVQAAEGLVFLHGHQIQHGGIKISNLLLAADGTVKLSDFGVSAVRDQSKSMSDRPKEALSLWMAPEEVTDEDVKTTPLKADIYSLGLCVIEAATGSLPFLEMEDKEVYDSKRAGEPVNRPEGAFTDQEWALVARMVDNNPDNRPTAVELVQLMSEQ